MPISNIPNTIMDPKLTVIKKVQQLQQDISPVFMLGNLLYPREEHLKRIDMSLAEDYECTESSKQLEYLQVGLRGLTAQYKQIITAGKLNNEDENTKNLLAGFDKIASSAVRTILGDFKATTKNEQNQVVDKLAHHISLTINAIKEHNPGATEKLNKIQYDINKIATKTSKKNIIITSVLLTICLAALLSLVAVLVAGNIKLIKSLIPDGIKNSGTIAYNLSRFFDKLRCPKMEQLGQSFMEQQNRAIAICTLVPLATIYSFLAARSAHIQLTKDTKQQTLEVLKELNGIEKNITQAF